MSNKKILPAQPQVQELSIAYKILAVICGGFLVGSLWRMRGDSGYGAKWGMFVVATGFVMFLFTLFPQRKKLSVAVFPFVVLLTGITAGGWGTLNSQMAGRLSSSALFAGETAMRVAEVNPWSGLFIMLCLGFGWMPLFAFFMGCFFSEKRQTFKHLVIAGLLLVGSYYLFRATLAHPVFQLFGQDATKLFKEGLADQGIAGSPYSVYMQHFGSDPWAKKVPFGRNYFTSVSQTAAAMSSLAVIMYMRFGMKDKRAARIALAVNSIVALSITVADLALVGPLQTSPFYHPIFVKLFSENGNWSFWEYFTGFFIGSGVTLLVMSFSRKKLAESDNISAMVPPLGGKIGFGYHLVFTTFAALILTTERPLLSRLQAGMEDKLYSETTGVVLIVLAVLAGLAVLGWLIYVLRSNLLIGGLRTPFHMPDYRYFAVTLAVYFSVHNLIYGFTMAQPYATRYTEPIPALMILSFAVVALCHIVLTRMQKKQLQK